MIMKDCNRYFYGKFIFDAIIIIFLIAITTPNVAAPMAPSRAVKPEIQYLDLEIETYATDSLDNLSKREYSFYRNSRVIIVYKLENPNKYTMNDIQLEIDIPEIFTILDVKCIPNDSAVNLLYDEGTSKKALIYLDRLDSGKNTYLVFIARIANNAMLGVHKLPLIEQPTIFSDQLKPSINSPTIVHLNLNTECICIMNSVPKISKFEILPAPGSVVPEDLNISTFDYTLYKGGEVNISVEAIDSEDSDLKYELYDINCSTGMTINNIYQIKSKSTIPILDAGEHQFMLTINDKDGGFNTIEYNTTFYVLNITSNNKAEFSEDSQDQAYETFNFNKINFKTIISIFVILILAHFCTRLHREK